MAFIRFVHASPLSVIDAWRRVTDWERHGARVPLTRTVLLTPPPVGVGTRFTAVTGIGRCRFDDPMEVTLWHPPAGGTAGRCRLEKRGRAVTGWAEIEVRAAPAGGPGCEVLWQEELHLRGLPRRLDGLLAPVGRLVFGRVVSGLLRTDRRPGA
ncbi:SRPBCC family protein [Streptomyces bambusae]|uniref:SRPBCC family protein n=1 Tax=Streptomyces bambusae TaxID=1550616 RepID=UPI001CFEA9F6|nr:SRPBCC family protein [Streptomyces bambusae]MCB5168239.1 SRPBCC family protein [Streptomyces bambusae]